MINPNNYRGGVAATYDADRRHKKLWMDEIQTIDYFIKEIIKLEDNKIVLDVPIGTGRFIFLYKKYEAKFIGIDISQDMINEALNKNADADLRIGDITDLDLPDKSVDLAVCVRLLNLIESDQMINAIAELDRVTKGDLIISMRTAPGFIRHQKSVTHSDAKFKGIMKLVDRYIVASKILKKDGYGIFVLRKKQ